MCHFVGAPWRGQFQHAQPEVICLSKTLFYSAEKAEPSETPWHTYDGTPTTA